MSEFPGRKRVLVHHRVLIDHLGVTNELSDVKKVESEVSESLYHFLSPGDVCPVLRRHLGCRYLASRNPVDQRPVWLTLCTRDRIDDCAAFARADVHHRTARQKRRRPAHAAPHDHTVPSKTIVLRIEGASNRGVDTVATHQKVGLGSRDNSDGIPPDELGPDATVLAIAETGQMMVSADSVAAKLLEHSSVQHAKQFAPMDRKLWPAITGGDPERLIPNPLAKPRIVGEVCSRHADLGELILKAELRELPDRVGQHVDPYSQLANSWSRLRRCRCQRGPLRTATGPGSCPRSGPDNHHLHNVSLRGRRRRGGAWSRPLLPRA